MLRGMLQKPLIFEEKAHLIKYPCKRLYVWQRERKAAPKGKDGLRAALRRQDSVFCPKTEDYAFFSPLHRTGEFCYNPFHKLTGCIEQGGAMQDADDSDAAPRDMFLNKVKRNKGIAAPFCTRAAALPFLLLTAWRAVRPPRQRAGGLRPAAGNRFE